MDDWIKEQLPNILLAIGIFSAIGVAAIFVIYFIIKHRIKKAKKNQEASSSS